MPKPETGISLIIPAFHEAERIGKSLEELARFLKDNAELPISEVIVITADSSDGTADIATSFTERFENFRVIELAKRAGKGRDVRHAMLAAKGRYRLFMDADLATPLHHLHTVHEFMKESTPVIIGVRDLNESHKGLRKFISEFGNLLVRLLLGIRVADTQCGFKAFRGDVAHNLFSKQTIDGWGFDMEVLAIAIQQNYEITSIDIDDWQDVEGGTFSNVAVTGALSTFRDLLKIKWNIIRGKYNA